MIISQTPLRVSFLGGGSDLPAFYREHGGAVLSTAIDRSVYVTVSKKFDNAVRVSYSRTEEVPHAGEVQHPLVRESMRLLGIQGGVEITSVADIPAKGTGLGSSSSFTVGLLHTLHAFVSRYANAERLASEACQIEIEKCGEPIGKQDQYAAAYGGFNFIRFNPDDTVVVEKVIVSPSMLTEIQSQLMFFYTGITRSASQLLARQSQEVKAAGTALQSTMRLVKLAETAYIELSNGRIDVLGPMLDESWQLKKTLTDGITNELIESAYAAAMRAGASGGKLLGAGGGGFLMFFVPLSKQSAVRAALAPMLETPFNLVPYGSRIIFVH
jgi:D-glycero-alpha-D-manno-heptose-7-phosphate kinase